MDEYIIDVAFASNIDQTSQYNGSHDILIVYEYTHEADKGSKLFTPFCHGRLVVARRHINFGKEFGSSTANTLQHSCYIG